MAPWRAVRQSKKARCGEGQDSNIIDRLSDLPDVVLRCILCRVPIKDAVRTSLLSKRWRHSWQSIPKLSFCQQDFRKRSNFTNLVERSLLLRDSFSVEEFTLACEVKSDLVRINSWIASVVMRNVQKLCLIISLGRELVVFPSCLFRCETLMRLRISFDRPHDLIMPSTVCLSSLEDLMLQSVRFVDYGSVQNLLFSCPALENLIINECHWMNVNGQTISAPNLQRLTVRVLRTHGCHVGDCCSGKVVINVPNVKFFTYFSEPPYAYRLVGSSSLTEAWLRSPCTTHYDSDVNFDGCSDLFQGLYNVRSLTLSVGYILGAECEDVFQGLPILCNMTKLKLDLGRVFLGSKSLATLLRRSPCLRILEITQGFSDDLEVSQALEPVLPCFQSQLKKIIVGWFSLTKENLDSVALLLRKAMVLDELVLYYVKTKEGDYPLEHLKKLPRGSKDCKISLLERHVSRIRLRE